jgi:hypothetical protein
MEIGGGLLVKPDQEVMGSTTIAMLHPAIDVS